MATGTIAAMPLARIIVPPPSRGLDMAAGYGWPQSAAVRAGDYLFVSGVVAIDPDSGERMNGTVTSEAHRVFQNLKLVLEAAGSSLERLVQVHAMIYDRIEYDALNRVYRQYVPDGPPARTVWSVQIIDAFKVQLDAIAIV
jgi:2-iminobutanoate/2-iminopropanoate deaminase